MSSPEAAQTPQDGLTVVATLYGAQLSVDKSAFVMHTTLHMSEPWTREWLSHAALEGNPLGRTVAYIAVQGLKAVRAIEPVGGIPRDKQTGPQTLFRATSTMLSGAIGLNEEFLKVLQYKRPEFPMDVVKRHALRLLSKEQGIRLGPDLLTEASAARGEHRQRTIYHMLGLCAADLGVAKEAKARLLTQIAAHPASKNGRRQRSRSHRAERERRARHAALVQDLAAGALSNSA